jgi:hypothetical protein
VYGKSACSVVRVAVGRGVTVGVGVSGTITAFNVADGFTAEAEEQAARKIKKNRLIFCFMV